MEWEEDGFHFHNVTFIVILPDLPIYHLCSEERKCGAQTEKGEGAKITVVWTAVIFHTPNLKS